MAFVCKCALKFRLFIRKTLKPTGNFFTRPEPDFNPFSGVRRNCSVAKHYSTSLSCPARLKDTALVTDRQKDR